eukprot:TRINITY_DN27993_c0_g1_i1.p1 TRINITY_DN27993_c0_g1~~TRINITY_DN27993_c0_g1_i1.p1  ORF type:complete len:766 (-),score=135.96 TRINITY_DN27993_c0_g1_i1:251-2548(-)
MKFAKQIEEYELPEWKGHYIPYKLLKTSLEELHDALVLFETRANATETAEQASGDAAPETKGRRPLLLAGRGRADQVGAEPVSELEGQRSEALERLRAWRLKVQAEATRVGEFVSRGLAGLESQLTDVEKMAAKLQQELEADVTSTEQEALWIRKRSRADSDESIGIDSDNIFLQLRCLEAVGRVLQGVQRLRDFRELNHAALYKILKKHDKLLGTHVGLKQLFPELIESTRLGKTTRFEALEQQLREVSIACSRAKGLGAASPEVVRLAAGLGRNEGTLGNNAVLLSFFLGCCASLFFCLGVLLALPENHKSTFSTVYFLAPMPVFQVCFSAMLSLWCVGAVAATCDKYNINHMFILGADPRCRIGPVYFFYNAAVLTTLWLLIFGLYVIDYKWNLVDRSVLKFFELEAGRSPHERTSAHFVIYPCVMAAATICVFLCPSRICRNRYKIAMLRSMKRTACAPMYRIDFADNIMGDVLTSVAKPLQEVPAALCYWQAPHPVTQDNLKIFAKYGTMCGTFTHAALIPIIGGLPYLWRALQCLRRYSDTEDRRHVWNFGKYVSSLSIIIVSVLWPESTTALVVVSAIATVYAYIWDIHLDWGLSVRDLRAFLIGSEDARSPRQHSQALSAAPMASSSSGSVVRDADERHHLPRRLYIACVVLDLLARCTWVVTLVPLSMISSSIVIRVLMGSIVASIEILRRAVWMVFRLEHEQVSNASGFRALLWVPSKLNATSKKVSPPCRRTPSKAPLGEASQPLLLDRQSSAL